MEKIKVSIIIKSLNEEALIEKCITSVINGVKAEGVHFKSEIILVDSLSTDNTVSIARNHPIKIVQFANKKDVSCGAAPQLGYQYSKGEYIYLLDGDMELCEGFLEQGLKHLKENSNIAGVGGKLLDTQIFSAEDQRRVDAYDKIKEMEFVSHLGGGGLYRKNSIESVIYFSHRGLKAFEEAELGLRLKNKNWDIVRINQNAALHTGYVETGLERLRRLWKNGRLHAHGIFLRSSFGQGWWWAAVRHLWFVFAPIIINI